MSNGNLNNSSEHVQHQSDGQEELEQFLLDLKGEIATLRYQLQLIPDIAAQLKSEPLIIHVKKTNKLS